MPLIVKNVPVKKLKVITEMPQDTMYKIMLMFADKVCCWRNTGYMRSMKHVDTIREVMWQLLGVVSVTVVQSFCLMIHLSQSCLQPMSQEPCAHAGQVHPWSSASVQEATDISTGGSDGNQSVSKAGDPLILEELGILKPVSCPVKHLVWRALDGKLCVPLSSNL